MTIQDISPVVDPSIAVWPGDIPFSRNVSMRVEDGDSVTLSSIECSLHTGSHADAPSHYLEGGETIDEVSLDDYIGPAMVLTLPGVGAIGVEEIQVAMEQRPERLLLRSELHFSSDRFPEAIRFFEEEAAESLGRLGLRLIGTDAPSVDALDSKKLPAHHAFGRHGVRLLENLTLSAVEDGMYELIALPLKIGLGDASPVRAILRR
jgi:arylformamidase